MNLDSIGKILESAVIGNGSIEISSLSRPDLTQNRHQLAVILDKKFFPFLTTHNIQTALISTRYPIPEPNALEGYILTSHPPRYALAAVTSLFQTKPSEPSIHPTAVIHPTAILGKNVAIGAFTVIHSGVSVGDNTIIHTHVTIEENAQIGENIFLHSGVRIGPNVVIGGGSVIHQNACIGADGFSFHVPHIEPGSRTDRIQKIYSLSGVVIGEDVEIGSNSNIDAGTLAPTRIGSHTKIDSLVQIGHNCQIGRCCILCGQVGVAGSVTIGDYSVLGGAVGVRDNLTIGEHVIVLGGGLVMKNLPSHEVYRGSPAIPAKHELAQYPYLKRAKEVYMRLVKLETRLNSLVKGG